MKVILIVTSDSIRRVEYQVFDLIRNNIILFNDIVEIEEQTNEKGDIVVELRESSINDLLRKVFEVKPEIVFIALQNSMFNPVHEKTLENILRTAGYKSIYVSHREDEFISFLSAKFAELKNESIKS